MRLKWTSLNNLMTNNNTENHWTFNKHWKVDLVLLLFPNFAEFKIWINCSTLFKNKSLTEKWVRFVNKSPSKHISIVTHQQYCCENVAHFNAITSTRLRSTSEWTRARAQTHMKIKSQHSISCLINIHSANESLHCWSYFWFVSKIHPSVLGYDLIWLVEAKIFALNISNLMLWGSMLN